MEMKLLTFLIVWPSRKHRISKLAQWVGSHFFLCSVISLMNSQIEFRKWTQGKKKAALYFTDSTSEVIQADWI